MHIKGTGKAHEMHRKGTWNAPKRHMKCTQKAHERHTKQVKMTTIKIALTWKEEDSYKNRDMEMPNVSTALKLSLF